MLFGGAGRFNRGQDGPKTLQDGAKTAQYGARTLPRRSKMAQDAFQTRSDASKIVKNANMLKFTKILTKT